MTFSHKLNKKRTKFMYGIVGGRIMKEDETVHSHGMEIGIYSLADLRPNPHTGETISAKQRIEEIIEAAKLADESGLDVFGLGEHHRFDYAVSSPSVVLSSISQVTKRIKLTTATTVFNTNDPVRLYEDFATLDLLSNGRAEIIAGRGAYLESFPLFGYDVKNYDELFEENITLFQKLNEEKNVTWEGNFRSPLQHADIVPRAFQDKLPLWVGVGSTPQSAARAGRLGTGLVVVTFGKDYLVYKDLVDIYRQEADKYGVSPTEIKVAVSGHTYLSNTAEQAKKEFFSYHSSYWRLMNADQEEIRNDFEQITSEKGSLFVGSSQQIIEKILHQYELFGHQRFMAQIDIGGMPFKTVVENIERLATEVAPVIRRETKK